MTKISEENIKFADELMLTGRFFGPTPAQVATVAFAAQWLENQAAAGFGGDDFEAMPDDLMPRSVITNRHGNQVSYKAWLRAAHWSITEALFEKVFASEEEDTASIKFAA